MLFSLFKIIEEVESPTCGKIQVVKDISGIRIVAGGISQSGWSMKTIWDKGISRIKANSPNPKNVLILGLGGGSVAHSVKKHWKETNIIGVDIDPYIINLGKKYLKLSQVEQLNIVIADAYRFILDYKGPLFDVILVDLFIGDKIPKKFRQENFLKGMRKLINPYGIIAINHLYAQQDKDKANNMSKTLRKLFTNVEFFYPHSNVIFICFSTDTNITKTNSLR